MWVSKKAYDETTELMEAARDMLEKADRDISRATARIERLEQENAELKDIIRTIQKPSRRGMFGGDV